MAEVVVRTEEADDDMWFPGKSPGTVNKVDRVVSEVVIGDTESLLSVNEHLLSPSTPFISFILGVAAPLGVTEIPGVPSILGGCGVENGARQTICLLKHS